MKKKITDPGFAAHRLIQSLEKRHDENALESLQRLAVSGNETAANVLLQALAESIHRLYGDLDKQRAVFTKLARQSNLWPGFITVENDCEKLNEKVIKFLHLGEDAPFNYMGKQFSRDGNPEVEAALILVMALRHQQRRRARTVAENPKAKFLPAKLPPFNRQTALEWWKAARKIFERQFGKNFENHRLFAKKYLPTDKGKSNSLSHSTWKRKVILSKMPQAFRSIARKS